MRLIRGLLSTAFHQQKPCEADRCLGGVAAGPKTVRACRFQSLQATKPKRFRPSILRRKVANALAQPQGRVRAVKTAMMARARAVAERPVRKHGYANSPPLGKRRSLQDQLRASHRSNHGS